MTKMVVDMDDLLPRLRALGREQAWEPLRAWLTLKLQELPASGNPGALSESHGARMLAHELLTILNADVDPLRVGTVAQHTIERKPVPFGRDALARRVPAIAPDDAPAGARRER
jgi:hypothetical protein